MIVARDVAGEPHFLAALFGIVVLFPALEQAVLALIVVLPGLGLVVPRRGVGVCRLPQVLWLNQSP